MSKRYSYRKSFFAKLISLVTFEKVDMSTYIEYSDDFLHISNVGNDIKIKYNQIRKLHPEKKSLFILDSSNEIITIVKYLDTSAIDAMDNDIRYYHTKYVNMIRAEEEQERAEKAEKERIRQEELQEQARLKEELRKKNIQEKFFLKQENIFDLYNKTFAFLNQNKYISSSEASEFNNILQADYKSLKSLEKDCDDLILDQEVYYKFSYIANVNYDFNKEVEESRENFLFNAFKDEREENFFKSINEPHGLTEKQMLACFINEDNNLILAGAGSGKTLTMVARAAYLIKNKLVEPKEILILAYNDKAARELRDRCKKIEYTKPYSDNKNNIATFHGFGYKLLQSIEKDNFIKPISEQAQNKIFKEILESIIANNQVFLENIVKYCMYYSFPFPDKKKYGFRSIGEYADFMKNYNIQSINPNDDFQFATFEECLIANFLFVNDINYEIKRYLGKQYFYINDYDLSIIYEQDNYGNYNAITKFNMFEKKFINENYIQLSFKEIAVDEIESLLREKLKLKNIDCQILSSEELFNKIRESKVLGSFIKLLKSFISLYKNNDDENKLNEIRSLNFDESFSSKRVRLFLEIFEEVFKQYEMKLQENNKIDFDDMIYKARKYIEQGEYVSPYKYIMIDEFQDISASRASLIKEVLKTISKPNLFCVGDDWQAIYRFTGSDIKFISGFQEEFGSDILSNCSKTKLDYTFRFNNKILETSTNFVTQNKAQETKDIKVITEVNEPMITIIHRNNEVDEQVVFSILNSIEKQREGKKKKVSVLILNRYGKYKNIGTKLDTQKYFAEEVNGKFKTLEVFYNTIHGSKGTEADYVILVDVKGGFFGFPTKKDNDEIIEMMLPEKEDHPFAEERRLMYVALTRAKKEVWIESIQDKESDFVHELRTNNDKYEVNEIDFNKKEKGSLNIDDQIDCPLCEKGKIVSTYNSKTKTWYNACNNHPYCNYTLKNCLNEECNANSSLLRNNDTYTCIVCSKKFKVCTTCNDGVRTQCYIDNINKTYINCSNISFLECKPKDNQVEDHLNDKSLFFPKCKRNL